MVNLGLDYVSNSATLTGANIVSIQTNEGAYSWDFGATGNLTLPTSGHIIVGGGIVGGGASPAPYISGFDSIGALEFTNGNSNVTVNSNSNLWTFDSTGNLTLPANTFAVNYANGTQVSIGGGGNTDWANIGNINNASGPTQIAIGANAGNISQGDYAVAIGWGAGGTDQGIEAVAVGDSAGANTQGINAVAVGYLAGSDTQGTAAVAIGYAAGQTAQGNNSIILNATGSALEQSTANTFTVAPVRNDVANIAEVVFYNTTSKEVTYGNTISVAGNITAGNISTGVITLTYGAVIRDTTANAVAFGEGAGTTSQGGSAVAVGKDAGTTSQGSGAVAVGNEAGSNTQSQFAVAIGVNAGSNTQGTAAVAVGSGAGANTQGSYAVAVGYNAGRTSQGNNSIILNATGANLNQTTANTFTVAPVRNDVANVGQVVFYNTTSKEVTYGNVISVTGNITGGNISATGSILATPAWTSDGAITLTATTTNPTKGTTTSDNISYRQLGAKQWEVVMTYIQTVANGVNGSGDYLFTLPNGLSFDTTLPSQQITTTNIGTNTYVLMSYIIPSGSGLINNGTLGGQVYPLVYNATKFRILTTSYGSAIQCWGSGYYSLGGDDPQIQLTFRFTST